MEPGVRPGAEVPPRPWPGLCERRCPRPSWRPGSLDQDPRLEDVARRLAAGRSSRRLVVVPLLFGGGPHLLSDLARRVAGNRWEVVLTPPLAAQPALLTALVEWTAEAVHRNADRLPRERWDSQSRSVGSSGWSRARRVT